MWTGPFSFIRKGITAAAREKDVCVEIHLKQQFIKFKI
jgi:hypothetical protein